MADNTKKISMELSVSTVNTESINRLRDDVKELAKQGDAAAPGFKELADELSKFAAQAAQLEQLERLDAALQEAAAGAAELTAKTRELRAEVDAQAAQAKAASDAEQANTAAIKAKTLDIKLLENAVKQLRLAESSGANATEENAQAIQQTLAVLSKVTGETRAYSASLDTNKTVIREAKQVVAELQAEKLQLQASGVLLKAAADQESAALKELNASYRVANTESERASRASRALSDEMGVVRDGARSAGLAVGDLGEAQRELAAQVVAAAVSAKELVQQQNALADTAAIEQAYKRTLEGINARIKLSQQEAELRQKQSNEATALAQKQADAEAAAQAQAQKAFIDSINARIKLSQQEEAARQKAAAEAIALAQKQSDEEVKAAAQTQKAHLDSINVRLQYIRQEEAARQKAATEAAAQAQKQADEEAKAAAQAQKAHIDSINARLQYIRQEEAARQKAAAEAVALAQKQADEEAKAAAQAQKAFLDSINTKLQYIRQEAAARQKLRDETVAAERKAAADSEKATRDAATAASNAMRDAFGAVGAKSAAALRAEIEQVREAMQMLAASGALTGKELDVAMRSGNAAIKALERDLREATGTLTLMDRAVSALKTTMGQLAAFFSLTTAVESTGRAFYEATKQIQSLELGLKAVYGDADIARKQIDFLREAANNGGIAVNDISGSFTKFSVATKEANIPIEQSNELFKELTRVSGLLGLSSASVDRALNALAQTASKGVVQLEELSGQLGDALPGALSLVAKGLGVTTGELMKMVEAGTLTHKQLIPALTIGLKSLEGQNDTLAGSVGRVSNAITEFYQQASDSSAMRSMTDGLNALAANFGTVVDVVAALGKGMLALKFVDYVRGIELFGGASRKAATDVEVQTAATAANTAALNANTAAKSANAAATATALVGTATATKAAGDAAAAATAQKTLLATAMGATGTAARGLMGVLGGPLGLITLTAVYAKDIGELAAKLVLKAKGMKTAEEAAAEMVKADADAKRKADELAAAQAAATLKLEMKVAKEIGALKDARVAADAKTSADEKGTLAAIEQGKTLEKLAGIRGDEVSKLDAATAASGLHLAAADREAASKTALVAAIEAELAKRKESAAMAGVESKELKKQQDDLEQLLAKKREEAAAAVATRDNIRMEVAERSTLSAAYLDNSGRVAELRAAMENAKAEVGALAAVQADGLPVSQAMSKAQLDLAQATALYRDATDDAAKMVDLAAKTQQADIQLKMAAHEAAKAQGEATVALGRALGDETAVLRGSIQVKEAELALSKLQQQATVAQAQARLDAARTALQVEIDKTGGELNPVKRAELELSIRQAEAALALARAKGTGTTALEQEIDALLRGNALKSASASAANQASGSIAGEADSRLRNASAIKAETEQIKAQQQARTDGGSFNFVPDDITSSAELKAWYAYAQQDWRTNNPGALNGTFMLDTMRAEYEATLQNLVRKERAKSTTSAFANGGVMTEDGPTPLRAYANGGVANEPQWALFGEGSTPEAYVPLPDGRTIPVTVKMAAQQTAPALPAPTPVVINLQGSSTRINVAAPSDATALQTLLQQLASGQSRSI